ncbi:hypothetical protein Pflav_004090 [Phytohabitans flavus]|uniref:Glycoside hydrolase family 42 N-terminal domain-containing protein n=1 Tax=Phytohabitans flavus TaxID=1076124 RepID=A0A6F8XJM2_9ACTN|nr:hypothetical protein Pflav_004090 [Phytohabitans flavus]
MKWPRGVDGLCYGGDYNPEQWPEDVWREDVALMRRAGVNLVSVGVFAWSRLEPEEGRYTFDWLDRVLDLLDAGGVKVALATPTASPPPWFSLAHPDALPVRADGTRLLHGSRDTYCASAPAYREACRRIARELARRYADHPAVALWHVHNEYGTVCHCDHAAAAFRAWLRDRYRTLDALNDAWTTAFWSQHYADWAYVFPPRATQYLPNPGQVLDFRRFWSDELLAAYVEQRDVLRAAGPDVPVTTNYVFGAWVPVDHARWAREVDLVAIDHYPSDAGPGAEEETAFAADLARSWAGGRPWLLMESAPNLVYTGGRMHAKEPGRMARHSLSHVARGSRGAMFFQWRAPRGGPNASTRPSYRTPGRTAGCTGKPSNWVRRSAASPKWTPVRWRRAWPSPGAPPRGGRCKGRDCRGTGSTTWPRCGPRTGPCGGWASRPTSCRWTGPGRSRTSCWSSPPTT